MTFLFCFQVLNCLYRFNLFQYIRPVEQALDNVPLTLYNVLVVDVI